MTAFPRELAIRAADLCAQVYALAVEPGALWLPSGWQEVAVLGDACLVARSPQGREWMVWRGTVNISEWILDAAYPQVPWGEGKVHAGFMADYRQFRGQLLRMQHHAPLCITGHSLGGALATLAALDLAVVKPLVITFGSPRVGNHAFAETYQAKVPDTWRVYNLRDVVSHLPPAAIPDVHWPIEVEWFEHVGHAVPVDFLAPKDEHFFGGNHSIMGYLKALRARKAAA
jgi:triacylglycerol lipase